MTLAKFGQVPYVPQPRHDMLELDALLDPPGKSPQPTILLSKTAHASDGGKAALAIANQSGGPTVSIDDLSAAFGARKADALVRNLATLVPAGSTLHVYRSGHGRSIDRARAEALACAGPELFVDGFVDGAAGDQALSALWVGRGGKGGRPKQLTLGFGQRIDDLGKPRPGEQRLCVQWQDGKFLVQRANDKEVLGTALAPLGLRHLPALRRGIIQFLKKAPQKMDDILCAQSGGIPKEAVFLEEAANLVWKTAASVNASAAALAMAQEPVLHAPVTELAKASEALSLVDEHFPFESQKDQVFAEARRALAAAKAGAISVPEGPAKVMLGQELMLVEVLADRLESKTYFDRVVTRLRQATAGLHPPQAHRDFPGLEPSASQARKKGYDAWLDAKALLAHPPKSIAADDPLWLAQTAELDRLGEAYARQKTV